VNISHLTLALLWGGAGGYLALRLFDAFIGIVFALHGLLLWRWKILATGMATGVAKPENILHLLLRLALLVLIYAILLQFVADFFGDRLPSVSSGSALLPSALAAAGLVLTRLARLRRRLAHYWRISHEFDYAERQGRTMLLNRKR